MARSSNTRLGGLGALFFLGSLGAIAFYVQRQSVPQERDLAHKAATLLPEVTPAQDPPALPWKDRLDLQAAQLVSIVTADASSTADAAPGGAENAGASEPKIDPAQARYVQDLNDGHRIMLTLDPVLQDSALTIFRNREVPYAGAVMVDLQDNSLLVLAGHSSMDPEVDPLEIVASAWAPAASTFKLVTTASLLDGEVATPATRVCFSGGLHGIEDEQLTDDPARDTRCETLSDAIAHSYNLVIGKLALRHLEQQQLADTARALLFETEIPFEFNVERSPAHIPSDAIERAKVAAGFWNVDLSPIHAALLASIFARGGTYQPPHIIDQVIAPDGSDLTPAPPRPERVIAKEVAEALGEMMVGTTTVGTASRSFRDKTGTAYIREIEVAGKTGSLTGKREPYLNYNWFMGFAPADRPEIAFAVLLANEPKWRIKAHYAARRLVQIYLERRDAIARQRDAKLTPQGIVLPIRDASGAVVQVGPIAAAPADETDAQTEPEPAEAQTPEADALPLPPPPGPVPAG